MVATCENAVNVLCAYVSYMMEGSARLFVVEASIYNYDVKIRKSNSNLQLTILAIARCKNVTIA